MPLSAGAKLGPYEILGPIGAGGMGEVFKARDTRLGRTVAIKISKRPFSDGFEREARAVAALNHPNVCTLYDVGPNYLVMEYVDGSPLKGPLPPEEGIPLAIQIAHALDAAHRRGIVHRDLKPANIVVAKSGVKLLDFGLAKESALQTSGSMETITIEGAIAGTLNYIAPEVLQGQRADARSDIFSFGCVLYELFTGRRAFDGADPASVIASILKDQPQSMRNFAPQAPDLLEHIVGKCLVKDPEERCQSVRDLASELQWIEAGAVDARAPVAEPRRRERWLWAAALLLLGATAGTALWRGRINHVQEPVMQFPLSVGQDLTGFSLSPDGTKLAIRTGGLDRSRSQIYQIDSGDFRPLDGIDAANGLTWSPDSRSIIVLGLAGPRLKVDLASGVSAPAFDYPSDWPVVANPDGSYLQGSVQGVVYIPQEGGTPKLVTRAGAGEKGHSPVGMLPDNARFLVQADKLRGQGSLKIAYLDGRPAQDILTSVRGTRYVDPGYLLYVVGETLIARPFDATRGILTGPAKPIVNRVALWTDGTPKFTASQTGVLAVVHGSRFPLLRLTWMDRAGKTLGTLGEAADYSNPALSPDGSRLAVCIRDLQSADRDIWILDLEHGTRSRLTFGPGDTINPVWSPDGTRIAYSSRRKTVRDLFVKNASGSGAEQEILQSEGDKNAESWSADGTWLAFNRQISGGAEIRLLNMTDPSHQAAPFRSTSSSEAGAAFSPDGKYIAYRSNESGRNEVFVRSVAPEGGRWQISNQGGEEPSWRRDGKELYFISNAELMAVSVQEKGGAFVAGVPRVLFKVPDIQQRRNRLVASPDGQKFLVVVPEQEHAGSSIHIIVNWRRLLAEK